MERMNQALHPAFTDVTWGAGGSTAELSLTLALRAQQTGHTANLHITCTNITKPDSTEDAATILGRALQTAYDGGIRNIVALRGDPPAGQDNWTASDEQFTCALDLVRFIRNHEAPWSKEMGISVAGYPEGHPNAIKTIDDPSTLTEREKLRASVFDGVTYCCLEEDYKKEMDYLKQKVDAGAGELYMRK
jgi:methylenetetrahydrofolate reductase (NADPH)